MNTVSRVSLVGCDFCSSCVSQHGFSCLPREAMQSQHSLAMGLSSWRVSFRQQDKQRPSSDRICSAGHTVQSLILGPRQSRQDGSHALQIGSSLLCSEPWSNRRGCCTASDSPVTEQPCQTAAIIICYSLCHELNNKNI